MLSGIAPNKRLAIAFSGGLDSRFLSFAAKYLGYTVKLLTVRGPHISAEETAEAVQWAQDNSFEMELLDLNPLQMEAVVFNHTDRCYFCKKHLFLELKRRAADLPLCDGTNHSDLSHYRPGLKALSELKIHSPLAEAEFSKQDNREVGALIGLDHWDQAARPCMLTRLPYNQKVLASDLTAVGGSRNGYESFLCRVKQGRNSFPASQGQSESFRNAYPKRRLRPAFRARARRGRASLGFFPALCRGSMAADGEALGIFRSASRKTGSLIGQRTPKRPLLKSCGKSVLFHARYGERAFRHHDNGFHFTDFFFRSGQCFFDGVIGAREKHVAGHLTIQSSHQVVLGLFH